LKLSPNVHLAIVVIDHQELIRLRPKAEILKPLVTSSDETLISESKVKQTVLQQKR